MKVIAVILLTATCCMAASFRSNRENKSIGPACVQITEPYKAPYTVCNQKKSNGFTQQPSPVISPAYTPITSYTPGTTYSSGPIYTPAPIYSAQIPAYHGSVTSYGPFTSYAAGAYSPAPIYSAQIPEYHGSVTSNGPVTSYVAGAYSPAPVYPSQIPAYHGSITSYGPVTSHAAGAYSPAPIYSAQIPEYHGSITSYGPVTSHAAGAYSPAPVYSAAVPVYHPSSPIYGQLITPSYRSNEWAVESKARSAYDTKALPVMDYSISQLAVFPSSSSGCAVPLLTSCQPSLVQGSIQYPAYQSYTSYVAPAVAAPGYKETEDQVIEDSKPAEVEKSH